MQECTPVQRKFRFTMNQPEGTEDVLGHTIGEASKGPGLPAHPLPGHVLEAGLQPGLAGLAGRKLLLELH